jgi:transcriptional regulator GlxA family with amidase domain
VQKALTFARENLKRSLSVNVLAEAARVLMATTRHSIDIIASETGFGNRERMKQSFLRAFGQSPQAIKRVSMGAR